MQRGEIYFVDLDPVQGREQSGYRPVVIVSSEDINTAPLVVKEGFPGNPLDNSPRSGWRKSRMRSDTVSVSEAIRTYPENDSKRTMHPAHEQLLQSRRDFLATSASGIGTLAVASLLQQEALLAADATKPDDSS